MTRHKASATTTATTLGCFLCLLLISVNAAAVSLDGDIANFSKIESSAELLLRTAESRDDSLYFKPLNVSAPPRFKLAQKLPSRLERTAGGLLTLSCLPQLAAVAPLPNISWHLNDSLLTPTTTANSRLKFNKWTLTVLELSSADAGSYKCRLCNAQGCIEHLTQVTVQTRAPHTAPQIKPGMPRNSSVVVGDHASFECPLQESLLEPHIVWLRQRGGNGSLAEKLLTREDEPQLLRLGNVQLEDAGWYSCLAANSVGRSQSRAYLEVLPSTTTTTTTTTTTSTTTASTISSTIFGDAEESDALADSDKPGTEERAPYFRKLNNMKRLQHSPSGSTIMLSCQADGTPSPNISWTLNGHAWERRIGALKTKNWSLRLDDATTEDSGTYTCHVCNYLGCIHFDYSVKILDRIRHKPIISDKFPQNQTVLVNQNATFKCVVVSDLSPAIYWTRVVERNRSVAHTVQEDGRGGGSAAAVQQVNLTMHLNEDSPHILKLNNVTHDQEGWYTCVASNSLGVSMTSAYLRVVDHLFDEDHLAPPEVYALLRSHPLGLTVAAVVLVALFVLGSAFTVYMLRRLRREKLLKHRIETVHQWTKKVIIYRPPSVEGNSCGGIGDLQMPVIKIEKQRTTFSTTTTGNADAAQGFNEYEFPLDSNWEIPRQQLTLGSILGEGAFGRVVMAEASGLSRTIVAAGTIVAVKMVKEEHTDADMASLVREMEVMKMIGKHINIINLLGCCSQGGPLYVIVEFAPHGNLKDFLKQHRPGAVQPVQRRSDSDGYLDDKAPLQPSPQLGEKELTMFAFQIARGMEYLASRRKLPKRISVRQKHLVEAHQTTRPSMSTADVAKYQKTYSRFTNKEKSSREFVAKRATLA